MCEGWASIAVDRNGVEGACGGREVLLVGLLTRPRSDRGRSCERVNGSTRSMRYSAVLVGRLWGLLAGERTRVSLHPSFLLNRTDPWLLLRGIVWNESRTR